MLELAINWARYAELFEFDANAGVLSLPEPEEPGAPEDGEPPAQNQAAQ